MPRRLITSVMLTVLLLFAACLLAFPSSAAQNVCDGYTSAAFSGLTACTKDGKLHICVNNFPDDNFRNLLAEQHDPDGDYILTESQIASIYALNCSYRDIISLEGIGYFTALTNLTCLHNKLTVLDLRNLPNLQKADCNNNRLNALYLDSPSLEQLSCANNELSTLEINAPALSYLDCKNNCLTELDLSRAASLSTLLIMNNQLQSIDLSMCPELSDVNLGSQVSHTAVIQPQTGSEECTVDLLSFLGAETISRVTKAFTSTHPRPGSVYNSVSGTVTISDYVSKLLYIYEPEITSTKLKSNPLMTVTVMLSCSHAWKEASCAAPTTCTGCGETKGECLPHTMQPATEIMPPSCADCGYKEGHPLEHAWISATCTTAKHCQYCDIVIGSPLGHDYTEGSKCQSSGRCLRCSQSAPNIPDHDWKMVTCNYYKCKGCGLRKTVPAKHEWSEPSLLHPSRCIYCNVKGNHPYSWILYVFIFSILSAVILTAAIRYLRNYKRERKY